MTLRFSIRRRVALAFLGSSGVPLSPRDPSPSAFDRGAQNVINAGFHRLPVHPDSAAIREFALIARPSQCPGLTEVFFRTG